MKQVRVKFPVKDADAMATKLYEIGFNVIVSWVNEDIFAGDYLTAIGVIPDEKTEQFKTDFKTMIVR